MSTYAAELVDNVVIRVIVGTAEWASTNLGGEWRDSPKIGPGWTWTDNEWRPPQPSPDCVWDNGWVCPEVDDDLPEL